MTKEDKDLLLKYLCAALPYGIKVEIKYNKEHGSSDRLRICSEGCLTLNTDVLGLFIEDEIHLNPYLRPMLSMTDEEKEKMHDLLSPEGTAIYGCDGISMPMNHYGEFVPYEFMNRIIQYLLKNHFDFMGLIPKGLAIEVTEDNNPYKK